MNACAVKRDCVLLLNDMEITQIKRNPGHQRYVSQGNFYILNTVHHIIQNPKVFYSPFLGAASDETNLIRAREPLVVEKKLVTSTIDGCSAISNYIFAPSPFGFL